MVRGGGRARRSLVCGSSLGERRDVVRCGFFVARAHDVVLLLPPTETRYARDPDLRARLHADAGACGELSLWRSGRG